MNEVKIRLPISNDTAFLLENPGAAKFAALELKPEALLVVLFELGTVADRITRIYKDIAASNQVEPEKKVETHEGVYPAEEPA
jgi:hypothetical protein